MEQGTESGFAKFRLRKLVTKIGTFSLFWSKKSGDFCIEFTASNSRQTFPVLPLWLFFATDPQKYGVDLAYWQIGRSFPITYSLYSIKINNRKALAQSTEATCKLICGPNCFALKT